MKTFAEFHERFRANLRVLRDRKGLRQQDLEEAGLSLRTVQHIESGDRLPKLDTLFQLAQAFQVHPADLLRVDDVKPEPRPRRGGPRVRGRPASRHRS